ncbi:hypothetical protein ES332_D04G112800v1 [Gossypium tomentosum]|uniref:Uncharacterized protein n=1 Tax=Gossypium tomentosum TaxID=34277 RepID=A0A5D2LBZ1_GOSTO|nr:hypothetical protein ES332_D04G112800v1 [Gossypium tomentosum]
MKIDGECLIELIGSCRNKVQVYQSVRMPQLHTSLHFHLTPIVMINGSSHRNLLLNSQNFCHSIPTGTENPLSSRLCYQRLWGSRNRRALILGWAYYLDAFSSYLLHTWLPSVYRGHDNWYTRGASFPVRLVRIFTNMSISPSLSPRQCPDHYAFCTVTTTVHRVFGRRLPCHQSPEPGHCEPLCEEAPLLPKLRGYFVEFLRESCLAPLGILYLPTCVSFRYRYPFFEGRSSFSWEYSMGYFSAVAPGPDSPSVDEPSGGTLGFSGHWILTNVCITQVDILASTSFGRSLSPIHLWRKSARSANLLAVSTPLPPLSLSGHLGALAGFRVCLDLVPLSRPTPEQCFTPRCPVNYRASTHFGENQLALGSSGISPLTTTHLLILQHQSARGQSPGLLPLLGRLCHPGVFSLARWSLLIHTGFHVPYATRVRALLPFRSPLLRESLLLSFPPATKMFQFARLSLVFPWIQQQFERLTYSGISGSKLIFNSPKHFVAYYALPHRTNCRIGKIGYYYIALFRLSSRVGDKWTRTADIRHRDSCGSGGSCYRKTRNGGELSPLRLFGLKNAGFYGRPATPGYRRLSNQNTQQALALPEKEVIQPHLPVRLPCYDFTPITSPAFGIPLLAVKVTTSGMASSHSVMGGVYKA